MCLGLHCSSKMAARGKVIVVQALKKGFIVHVERLTKVCGLNRYSLLFLDFYSVPFFHRMMLKALFLFYCENM